MAIKAVLHARVSTPQQRTGYSLQTMLEDCRSYAAQLGFEVIEEIGEDYSGGALETVLNGLARVLDLIREGAADAVIFYEVDRVSRGGIVDFAIVMQELKGLGASVYFAKRRTAAGESPDDVFLDNLLAAFAQRERSAIRERTERGRRGKAAAGLYAGNGRVPFGYRRVVDTRSGKTIGLEVNPAEAPVVADLFRLYVYGDGSGRLPITEIVARLGLGWNRATVYKLLRNPVYKGEHQAYRIKVVGKSAAGKPIARERPLEERIAIAVPAIVDSAVWEAAQSLLDEGRQRSRRNSVHSYLLSGRARCHCGYALTGRSSSTGGRTYSYYHCVAARGLAAGAQCNQRAIRADKLDAAVWAWVQRRLITSEAVGADEGRRAETEAERLTYFNRQLSDAAAKLGRLDGEEQTVLRQLRKGLISERAYAAQLGEINQEREIARAAQQRAAQQRDAERHTSEARHSVDSLVEAYRSVAASAPLSARRAILDALDVTAVLESGARAAIYSAAFPFQPELDTVGL